MIRRGESCKDLGNKVPGKGRASAMHLRQNPACLVHGTRRSSVWLDSLWEEERGRHKIREGSWTRIATQTFFLVPFEL